MIESGGRSRNALADRGVGRDRRDLDLADRDRRGQHLAAVRVFDLVDLDDVEVLADGDALRRTDVERHGRSRNLENPAGKRRRGGCARELIGIELRRDGGGFVVDQVAHRRVDEVRIRIRARRAAAEAAETDRRVRLGLFVGKGLDDLPGRRVDDADLNLQGDAGLVDAADGTADRAADDAADRSAALSRLIEL